MTRKTTNTLYLDDARLAKRLVAGDEKAFEQFFNDNYDRLYRFALSRMPSDKAAAEDVVQQCFTKALDRIDTYRGEAQLFTWLCSICRNQVIDHLRQFGRQRDHIVLVEDFPELQSIVESFHAPTTDDPYEIAQREESLRLIQVVLDRLPVNYGNILEWRYIEGFSAKETAERLGLSVDATGSLTARAKRAFAELYRPLAQAANTPLSGGLL